MQQMNKKSNTHSDYGRRDVVDNIVESMMSKMFLEFIELHEALLARRMLQNSLSKEKPQIQKAFMTTRETKFEKREKKLNVER